MAQEFLCVYYSRTGKTAESVHAIAKALGCETVELTDEARRGGVFGWLRCGFEAVRKRLPKLDPVEFPRPLGEYRTVILGTPVWAGRCSSVMRAFLDRYGKELPNAALVITHSSEETYPDVFRQMDRYLPQGHVAEASLCPGSAGYDFWLEQFLKTCTAEK